MLKIEQVKIPACFPEISLRDRIASIIDAGRHEIKEIVVLRKSLDARRGKRIYFVYNVLVSLEDERLESRIERSGKALRVEGYPSPWNFPVVNVSPPGHPVVVVGAGPAGLFAAYTLAHFGFRVILAERGRRVEERVRDVSRFWREGVLAKESNIQFGEGGAGTFSDGKLTTRIGAPEAGFVIHTFADLGGGEEVRTEGKPHIGTNRLRTCILSFREKLTRMEVVLRFGEKVGDLDVAGGDVRGVVLGEGERITSRDVVLAPGHSARDNYPMLQRRGVELTGKPFAVGLRVEHPQALIDDIQYGEYAGSGCLPPAEYRLAVRTSGGRPVYSFCMCPGGFVILSSSEGGDLPVNGMSPTGRRTGSASSGIVAAVGPDDYGGGVFDGLEFQRSLERKAFGCLGGRYGLLSSSLGYFLSGKGSRDPIGGKWAGMERVTGDLGTIFPNGLRKDLVEGIYRFDTLMKGFVSEGANAYAVESRTSSPVRIVRGKDYQSLSVRGLYPAGEGAGYAGGIVSSAVDGIRAAMAIVRKYQR